MSTTNRWWIRLSFSGGQPVPRVLCGAGAGYHYLVSQIRIGFVRLISKHEITESEANPKSKIQISQKLFKILRYSNLGLVSDVPPHNMADPPTLCGGRYSGIRIFRS
ncbi:MAG: hypothetical protein A3G33_03485 [Omnitrophica bacterium RIFCSPLOWO2_12_FULL_44_17]|uniref:Uncharacterized protein n=1 Tax=Candidatus Danuiimicrobium aquiferis TaxID=1801832 RepID=A0A1G1KTX1_9BACT|nr:MAG: hypothetical protein A3B72_07030 [Omnitrophica bacterium RIFCSPHIGHO2_02_FULL_45_28]OGW96378.1 MAG: hypothetical protein A3G33_03485 [Omnitrophica bacterium RIFCSPLOWO2_12_FULL_44_17]